MFNTEYRTKLGSGGQVMLLSIMILGGVMLSASVIGGVVLLHQIKQVHDAESSAKAVFASDTGIEYASWCYFKEGCSVSGESCTSTSVTFDDDTCFVLESITGGGELRIISRGRNVSTERVLETVFISTTTAPSQ